MQIAKSSLLFSFFFTSVFFATAQVKLPSLNGNSIKPEVVKAVEDYPNQFKNITAEEISQNPQTTEYRSTIKISGGEECIVTKYTSKKTAIYSWHALVLSTEDFKEAEKKYKALCNQLNGMTVHLGAHNYIFKGKIESPAEEKTFTSTLLMTDAENEMAKKMRIEVVMENELLEWKVKVLVYGLERDDTDPAPEKEN